MNPFMEPFIDVLVLLLWTFFSGVYIHFHNISGPESQRHNSVTGCVLVVTIVLGLLSLGHWVAQ
jgi:hypothetical protein